MPKRLVRKDRIATDLRASSNAVDGRSWPTCIQQFRPTFPNGQPALLHQHVALAAGYVDPHAEASEGLQVTAAGRRMVSAVPATAEIVNALTLRPQVVPSNSARDAAVARGLLTP